MVVAQSITMSREELYRRIWEKPVDRVAKELGISNVGLGKACRRHQIPVPPRGYWAKKVHGHRVRQEPLRRMSDSHSETVTFVPQRISRQLLPRSNEPPELTSSRKHETDPAHRIEVPARLPKNLHPVLRKSRDALMGPQAFSLTNPEYHPLHGCVHLSVFSGPSFDRACRVLQAVLTAADGRGYELRTPPRRYETGGLAPPFAQIVVLGEPIDFRIFEPTRQIMKDQGAAAGSRVEYEATGDLVLEIAEYGDGERRRWKDTTKRALEDCLNEFMVGLVAIALVLRRRRLEREELHRQYQAAEARRQLETHRRQTLSKAIENWSFNQQLREFLAAVDTALVADPTLSTGTGEWLDWARNYVQRTDPVSLFFSMMRPGGED